jgi:hypothetical protein
MNFKEIFHFNNFLHKIKLDSSEKEHQLILNNCRGDEPEVEVENVFGNEWNQEYELIYSSYILDA